MIDRITYGQNEIIPDTAVAAWGARLVVTQDGYVDMVPDRMGSDAGPRSAELLEKLQQRFPGLQNAITELLRGSLVSEGNLRVLKRMETRKAEDFTLYDDGEVAVHANTNASAGYCYVTAWLLVVVCPAATSHPDGTPATIIGCGSTNVTWDGDVFDCADCGISFSSQEIVPAKSTT